MEITIVRGDPKPWGIDGHLYINRKLICDTVEHPTRALQQGDYLIEQSAISHQPSDTIIPSPFRHGDGALALKQREIIVGRRLLPGVVTASQATYDRLYGRLKKAFQRGTPVRLNIRG